MDKTQIATREHLDRLFDAIRIAKENPFMFTLEELENAKLALQKHLMRLTSARDATEVRGGDGRPLHLDALLKYRQACRKTISKVEFGITTVNVLITRKKREAVDAQSGVPEYRRLLVCARRLIEGFEPDEHTHAWLDAFNELCKSHASLLREWKEASDGS